MAEELVELGRRKCSRGKILRKGFVTKRGVKVKASCVSDTGASGKTSASKRILPKPRHGELKAWQKNMPSSRRHKIVASISREVGCARAIRRLTLLRNLTTDKATERAAKADADWLRRQGFCHLKTK